MSVIDTLVTDRTQADVSRRAYLKERVSNKTATEDETTEWVTALKGAYNYTDWNRVGEACAYLHDMMASYGYTTPGYIALRTDFTAENLPNADYWKTYLSTVKAIKDVWAVMHEIPDTMRKLDFEGANNIEKALAEVERIQFLLEKSFVYSAECWAGEF